MVNWVIYNESYYVNLFEDSFVLTIFTSLGSYFLFFRRLIHFFLPRVKLTKKERKAQNKQFRNRTKREHAIAFGRWILFKGYKEEQKNKAFYLFVAFNYLYLFLVCIYCVLRFAFFSALSIVSQMGGIVLYVLTIFEFFLLNLAIIVVAYEGIYKPIRGTQK